MSFNVNILAGSMPEVMDNKVSNVSHVLQRNDKIDRIARIHITLSEEDELSKFCRAYNKLFFFSCDWNKSLSKCQFRNDCCERCRFIAADETI